MSFLAPAAFGLALLLPVIVAMYLLKLRRTEQVVPSVYLWRRMVRDIEANAPWQRLRRNLLLLLQLLFLAALILALARPFTWKPGAGGQALIVILDVSASMAATDVNPNRMEAAKEQARQLVESLSDGARATIIAAGDGAEVLVASTQDRRQALQAIDSVQVTLAPGDLTSALQLAAAIAARQPDTEVAILSDGKAKLPERLAIKGQLRYLPIGLSGENQAISLLNLEKARAGQSLSAFAQISNFSSQPAVRRLELYADGELVDAAEVHIPARGQQAYLNQDLPLETQVLEARLAETECPAESPCEPDALPLDDRAWAVQRAGGPAGLTLVTQGNRFLETALALLPEVQVTTVEPDGFEATQPSDLAGQLVVFDAYAPITATLPGGPLLFIGPPRSTELFSVTGKVEAPAPRPLSPDDPLLSNVNLAGVSVLDAARIPLPEWAHSVIAGDVTGSPEDSVPLLFAGEVEGRRVAVLSFDLRRSDLPLQVAFPLLLANLTGWLSPGGGCPPPQEGQESAPCTVAGSFPTQAVAGQALSLALPLEAQQVTLTRPDGSRSHLEPQGGQVALAGLDQLGVYQLDWGTGGALTGGALTGGAFTGGTRFAANLFLAQESDILPAGNLPLEGGNASAGGQVPQQARQEWWRPLALAAIIFLVAEWLVYHRATLNRMLRILKLKAARS